MLNIWIYLLMENYEAMLKCRLVRSFWLQNLTSDLHIVANFSINVSQYCTAAIILNHATVLLIVLVLSWKSKLRAGSHSFDKLYLYLHSWSSMISDCFVPRFQIVSAGFHGEVTPNSSRDKFCVHSYNLSAWSSQSSSSNISSTGTSSVGVVLCWLSVWNTNVDVNRNEELNNVARQAFPYKLEFSALRL